jgi:TM2 domain-containing membrane protein YozV
MRKNVWLMCCIFAFFGAALPIEAQTDPEAVPEIEAHAALDFGPAAHPANYAGLGLSLILPGGGQFYYGYPVKGGMFLAFEVTAGSIGAYWWSESRKRKDVVERFKDEGSSIRRTANGDSATLYLAGLSDVWAERYAFESRRAKFTAYNATVWMLGGHFFGLMDAVGASGLVTSGGERSPAKAGWFAAVPGLGLGQLYNGYPSKGGLLGGAQISLAFSAYNQHRLMNDASKEYNRMRDSTSNRYDYRAEHLSYWKGRYDNAFSTRNTYLWLGLFTYLYSIFDAIVDANLSDYADKIRIDPDLTVGSTGALQSGAALRVSW